MRFATTSSSILELKVRLKAFLQLLRLYLGICVFSKSGYTRTCLISYGNMHVHNYALRTFDQAKNVCSNIISNGPI